MSTKTTFKRIALVAVAALGLGVLSSVSPASAAGTDNANITAITAGTSGPARVGVAGGTTTITLTVPSGSYSDTVTAQITSAPATSVDAALTFSAGATKAATTADYTDASTKTAQGAASGIATAVITATAGSSSTTTNLTLKLTADVAGTYQILVTADAAATGYSAGKLSVNYSITTAGAPTTIAVSSVGKVVNAATNGAVLAVSLKDAAGNATVLGLNEALSITKTTASAITLSATSLGSSTSNTAGVYYVTAVDGGTVVTGSDVITFTGSGLLPSTLLQNVSVSTVATTGTGGTFDLTSATGYVGSATPYKSAGSSHSFTLTVGTAVTAATNYPVDVVVTGGLSYATSLTIAAAGTTGAVTVSQALNTTTTAITVTSDDAIVVNYEAPAADAIAVQGSTKTVLSATGGKNTFVAKVTNQYGSAIPFIAVSVAVAGRNTVASTTLGVTDANGLISYSLTDAGTTGTKDTITFTAAGVSATDAAVVNYGTVTASTVTVSGGSKAETIAGSTLTAINGADNGPEASRVAIKAVVKDASGNLLAGVPVTFAVDKGAVYKTAAVDYATVYTGSDGAATSYVFNWTAGKQTVTATAGAASSTDYLTWAGTDASTARVLSATATGDIVSLKVVDRFGNPVKGVAINLSRTGSGLFGTGASTQDISTDKNGTADVRFVGSGTVVAELAATYAQAYDAAGFIAETAVTAAVAGTTKGTGASLAPAGVAKVSVEIAAGSSVAETNAQAAADAAAEATDAANAATDAANAAAEAADAATAAAQDAADAVAALSTQVTEMVNALKKQITALTNLVIKIQKKVKA